MGREIVEQLAEFPMSRIGKKKHFLVLQDSDRQLEVVPLKGNVQYLNILEYLASHIKRLGFTDFSELRFAHVMASNPQEAEIAGEFIILTTLRSRSADNPELFASLGEQIKNCRYNQQLMKEVGQFIASHEEYSLDGIIAAGEQIRYSQRNQQLIKDVGNFIASHEAYNINQLIATFQEFERDQKSAKKPDETFSDAEKRRKKARKNQSQEREL